MSDAAQILSLEKSGWEFWCLHWFVEVELQMILLLLLC